MKPEGMCDGRLGNVPLLCLEPEPFDHPVDHVGTLTLLHSAERTRTTLARRLIIF
jgi:hypothetical protein